MAPAELQDALLTMDVVDQLRYRNAEMKALADSGHDKAALKRRLLELYRSQGIEVSDEILEAGIQAQREQRYLYTAPRGWKAWLARRWIDRARLLKWALAVVLALLVLVALLVMARSFGAFVHDINVQNNVQALNDKVAAQQQEAVAARALLAAQEQALQGLLPRASASGDRLQPLTESAQAALAEAQRHFAELPATMAALPTLVRKDKLTRLSSGGSATGERAAAQVEQQRLAAAQRLANARDTLPALTERVNILVQAVEASELLDTTNTAAKAARLTPDAEQVRARAYTGGDVALRAGDMAAAGQAVSTLKDLISSADTLAALNDRLARLKADGLATGVAGEDRKRFERALDQAARLIRVETLAEAGPALDNVSQLVGLLSQTLVYRIVNRDDERTGVWRYNEKANGGRNYYLVAEALDEAGNVAELPIRNEETGKEERVSVFAVRVPQATYNRVAADKQDNGIIEDDLIGSKPRGSLSPRFRMPTTGGYITEW
ncbi:hypothetical protein JAK48_07650 [Stenotrophomonas maltophilia]|uniref:DUF6384 family protein n=1 Tax=Stenotrophomonas pavanii TaxID=487698 RepID=UPI0013E0D0CA|nr:DUF6384 family protein [Stenotrophomonas pavanii]MCU1046422.1 hypothetical protein [Stenotrophomonas maltophilia]NGM55018.1 hypothetical protein [Stenotrophomonas pavanii]